MRDHSDLYVGFCLVWTVWAVYPEALGPCQLWKCWTLPTTTWTKTPSQETSSTSVSFSFARPLQQRSLSSANRGQWCLTLALNWWVSSAELLCPDLRTCPPAGTSGTGFWITTCPAGPGWNSADRLNLSGWFELLTVFQRPCALSTWVITTLRCCLQTSESWQSCK